MLDHIEALTEQLKAARADAKEAEAYAEGLEREIELNEQEACMLENDFIKADKQIDALKAKLAKAVELLKEARQDLEWYVTHEWPKDEHPVYERKWERDMELCRRIDATLAEIEGAEP
jgi:predicted  nucleic acid-binding Zn-ribbon protein